jgi:TetR/AcrR family fatty acid metabolism transcriptional regulator
MKENPTPDKKMRILQAAVKVFSDKGFHEAKMEKIAEAADVGKGTVYEYFKSKEELFVEMFKSGSEYYMRKVKDEIDTACCAEEKLFKVMEIHFNFMRENRDLARLIMQEHHQTGKYMQEWGHRQREGKIKLLTDIIIEGVEKKEFKTSDPNITASLIFGMVAAMGGMFIFSPEPPNVEDIIASIKEVLTHGIIV